MIIYFFIGILIAKPQIQTAKEKNRILMEKTLATKDGLIILNEEQAEKFLLEHPRNYDLLVLFYTSKNPLCNEILEKMKKVVKAYKE